MLIQRRDFVVVNSALCASLALEPAARLSAADKSRVEGQLVELGINALARAASMKYFADGHRGASMISASMMCTDNKFDDAAVSRIGELFDLNWANSKLCSEFQKEEPDPKAIEKVGKTLAEGGETLREVGHDAIFAMHAIKAFRMMPHTATPTRVRGVCDLIRAFKPWRDVVPAEGISLPDFSDQRAAARFVLKEACDAIDRFIGYGQGFAGHMLTFGQSLIELASMGDVEWAEGCRTAFLKYITVTRLGPQSGDRKINEHKFSELRPDEAQYWRKRNDKSLGLGHVFKYPYAYYDLLAKAQDPVLEKEFESKAWRLF